MPTCTSLGCRICLDILGFLGNHPVEVRVEVLNLKPTFAQSAMKVERAWRKHAKVDLLWSTYTCRQGSSSMVHLPDITAHIRPSLEPDALLTLHPSRLILRNVKKIAGPRFHIRAPFPLAFLGMSKTSPRSVGF